MSSLTKQLYKDFKFIYKITGKIDFNIFSNITFITALMSNLYAIIYSSTIKILYIICLYFIEN